MVIDENGGDPVEVLVMSKGSFPGGGSISPASSGETWIVFNDHDDIYKIRPDGSDQTLVLCSAGTDASGTPYTVGGDAVWSPDGSVIVLWVGPEDSDSKGSLAVIPANHTDDGTCTSPLVRIYDFTAPWGHYGGPAWNHDGSRIVFTEWRPPLNEVEEVEKPDGVSRLVVIERQASGAWQEAIDSPIPLDYDSDPGYFFSWRPLPESDLLIAGFEGGLGQFDLWDPGAWTYVEDGGSPIQMGIGSLPRWSPDGDKILYTDSEGDLVIWEYLVDGSGWTVDTGTWADWQRDAVVGFCGDGACAGSEDQCNCALDCGAHPSDEAGLCTDLADNDCDGPVDCDDSDCTFDAACIEPFCGDGFCDLDETQCDCPEDCGPAPFDETSCTDGVDNDCDGDFDCDDPDCSDDQACTSTCGAKGEDCTSGADCCSGLCHPKQHVCK